jgi:fluoroacetyl-CoA thioesterase
MTEKSPPVGLTHRKTVTVEQSLTVPHLAAGIGNLRDMPPVFATAYLVAFVEATCIEALGPYLAPHQRTVGIHVDMSHTAATPVGMTVTAEVELVAVEGRRLRFKVACRDDAEPIGSGLHDRAIIDAPKFLARVDAKAGKADIARSRA